MDHLLQSRQQAGFEPRTRQRVGECVLVSGVDEGGLTRHAYGWALRGTQLLELHASALVPHVEEESFRDTAHALPLGLEWLYPFPLGQPEVRIVAEELGLPQHAPLAFVEAANRVRDETGDLIVAAELWRAGLLLDGVDPAQASGGLAAAIRDASGSLLPDGPSHSLSPLQRWHSWHGIALARVTHEPLPAGRSELEASAAYARSIMALEPELTPALSCALYDLANVRYLSGEPAGAVESLRERVALSSGATGPLVALRQQISGDPCFSGFLDTEEARVLFTERRAEQGEEH